MGKVKVRVVGDEQEEQNQKNEQKQKREAKNQAKGLNMGGGQRLNSVGPTEEEVMAESTPEETAESNEQATETKGKKSRGKKQQAKEARVKSKRYQENASHVAKETNYPIKNALETLRKFKKGNFDETVELHINTKEKGLSGQIALPHGTGKKLRIVVADDAVIEDVSKGKIEFDVLVAAPSMMPKLARVAKILGPRGLMPNPKAGTITDKPEVIIEKLSKGQVNYKTETAAPIIHLSVGKLSFTDDQLTENINTSINTIGAMKIENITLKSTMSPAVRLQV